MAAPAAAGSVRQLVQFQGKKGPYQEQALQSSTEHTAMQACFMQQQWSASTLANTPPTHPPQQCM
jgi:hypothetical protein